MKFDEVENLGGVDKTASWHGNGSFENLFMNPIFFVDKTLFIKQFMEHGNGVMLFTRPRRWGKTFNFRMLEHFLSMPLTVQGAIDLQALAKKKEQYKGLAIGKFPAFIDQHCGQYPVFSFSGSNIFLLDDGSLDFKSVVNYFVDCFKKPYFETVSSLNVDYTPDEYKKLLEEIEHSENFAIFYGLLKKLFQKIRSYFGRDYILLFDEYDKSINALLLQEWKTSFGELSFKRSQTLEKLLRFHTNVFECLFKDNSYLKKGALTGVSRLSKENLLLGVNNLSESNVFQSKDKFHSYFGFSKIEVEQLCDTFLKLNQEDGTLQGGEGDIDLKKKLCENFRKHYNGYQIGQHVLYNPWSIVQELISGNPQLQNHRAMSGADSFLKELVNHSLLWEDLCTLLEGKEIQVELPFNYTIDSLFVDRNAIWSFFIMTGYLTFSRPSPINSDCFYLKIPNLEVFKVFKESFSQLAFKSLNGLNGFAKKMSGLLQGDPADLCEWLSSELLTQTSFFHPMHPNVPLKESAYHTLVCGLSTALCLAYGFNKEVEVESGMGRADMILVSQKYQIAWIFEFKVAKKVQNLNAAAKLALKQIKDRQYSAYVEKTIPKDAIYRLGISFFEKKMAYCFEGVSKKRLKKTKKSD